MKLVRLAPLLPILTALLGGIVAMLAAGALLYSLILHRVKDSRFEQLSDASRTAALIAMQTRQSLLRQAQLLDLPSHSAGCSPTLQRHLQDILLQTPGIRAVMRIENGIITCATTGTRLLQTAMGPPSNIREGGLRSWHDIEPFANYPESRYVMLESRQLAMLVLPSEQFARLGHARMGLAVYESRHPPLASYLTPGVPNDWLRPMGVHQQHRSVDPASGTLRVHQRGGAGEPTTLTILPGDVIDQEVMGQFRRLASVVLVPGLLVAGLILAFWRRPGSHRREFERALRGNGLFLLYQPVVELESGRPVAVEALLRWRNADGEVLTPDRFLPMVETHRLSARLTDKVCQLLEQDMPPILNRHPGFMVGLNVAAQELSDRQLARRMITLQQRLGLAHGQLVVELTESSLVESEHALPVIESMRDNGISIAIDDFGTGYCSLSYLSSIPFDILKIDRAFVNAAGTDAVISPIAEHVVALARAMGVDALAEGIESADQAQQFRQMGVRYAQGYFHGRPMSAGDLSAFLVSATKPSRTTAENVTQS